MGSADTCNFIICYENEFPQSVSIRDAIDGFVENKFRKLLYFLPWINDYDYREKEESMVEMSERSPG